MTQTQSNPQAITNHPKDRHPHAFERGLYLRTHPGQRGQCGFHWFETDAETLSWLAQELPSRLIPSEAGLREALAQEISGVGELERLPLERINAIAPGCFELSWAGSFLDLAESDHPFARGIQADFDNLIFPDERGQGPEGTRLEDFAEHLKNHRSD